MADVTHELARQVIDRIENASRNNVALNLGKPDFDLVQPRRVGWGVVNAKVGMGMEETKDLLSFVSA